MAWLVGDSALFFHIPKTGGTWVHAFLAKSRLIEGEIWSKHAHYRKVCGHPAWPQHRERFRFCFVRRPSGWYESFYKHIRRKAWKRYGRWHINGILDPCRDCGFAAFVRCCIKRHPGYVTWLYRQYTPHMDYVGKQERLREDVAHVLGELGLSYDEPLLGRLKRRQVSGGKPVVWDRELLAQIEELEHEAYEAYSYRRV